MAILREIQDGKLPLFIQDFFTDKTISIALRITDRLDETSLLASDNEEGQRKMGL
jgi:hypothetical protein